LIIGSLPYGGETQSVGAERFAGQNFLNPRLAQRDIDFALDYRGTDGGYFEAAMERPDMWAESFLSRRKDNVIASLT